MKQKIESYKRNLAIIIGGSIFVSLIVFLASKNFISLAIALFLSVLALSIYCLLRAKIKAAAEVKKMEEVFPDFIELMSSNLRAGMTIDRALLLSARKEFAPLDREITLLGKDIVTGKEISQALLQMATRINSEKIKKTVNLIISGIKSGGNISVLLEETAVNMRERAFIEKRSASNVLMYMIFIFFAVAAGAPLLFGLSASLVKILTSLLSTIPVEQTYTNAPFTLTKITISVDFINYLCLAFIVSTGVLASMIMGLVNKGEEKAGLKYALPLIAISVGIFFAIKSFMTSYFASFFG